MSEEVEEILERYSILNIQFSDIQFSDIQFSDIWFSIFNSQYSVFLSDFLQCGFLQCDFLLSDSQYSIYIYKGGVA
jgi:hypothetical protein